MTLLWTAYNFNGFPSDPTYPTDFSAVGSALSDGVPEDTATGLTSDNSTNLRNIVGLDVIRDTGAVQTLEGAVQATAKMFADNFNYPSTFTLLSCSLDYSLDAATWTNLSPGDGTSGGYLDDNLYHTTRWQLASAGVSFRYLRLRLRGGGSGWVTDVHSSITLSDFRFTGITGSAPRQLVRGQTATVVADGTYATGYEGWDGGGSSPAYIPAETWAVDDGSYNLLASTSSSSGWGVSSPGAGSLSITVPAGVAVGSKYTAYYEISSGLYYYAVFDVVAAGTDENVSVGEPTGTTLGDGVFLALASVSSGEGTGVTTGDSIAALTAAPTALGEPSGSAGPDSVSVVDSADSESLGEVGGGQDGASVSVLVPVGEVGFPTPPTVGIVRVQVAAVGEVGGFHDGANEGDAAPTAVSVFQGSPLSQPKVTSGQDIALGEPSVRTDSVTAARFIGVQDGIGEGSGTVGPDAIPDFPAVSFGPEDGIGEVGFGSPGLSGDLWSVITDDGTVFAPSRAEVGLGRDAVQVLLTTATGVPPPVTGLAAVQTGASTAQISWNAFPPGSVALTGWYLYLGGNPTPALTIAPGTTSANLTALSAGQHVTAEVSGFNSEGEGERRSVSFLITDISAAPAPASLTATPEAMGALLAWPAAAPGDATPAYYDIYESGVRIDTVKATGAASYTRLILGLMPGVTYSFTVRSRAATGVRSADSPAASVVPLTPPEGFMTPAQFGGILDWIARQFLIIKGDGDRWGGGNADPDLVNDWGQSRAARELVTAILHTEDENAVIAILPSARAIRQNVSYQIQARSTLGSMIASLNSFGQSSKINLVSDLDSLLTYYNLGSAGPYACLAPASFAELVPLCGTRTLTITNVGAACGLTLATQIAGGAYTAGVVIDNTAYAGAQAAVAVITGFTGVGGALTVHGTARDASGVVQTGRTFGAVIAGSDTLLLTPSVASDLLLSVDSLDLPGGMTGGTVVIQSAAGAGRFDPTP